MFSQHRKKKAITFQNNVIDEMNNVLRGIVSNQDFKYDTIDPIIEHIITKLQPWILTLIIVFGSYFVLIIIIIVLIVRNDIKR